MWVIIVLAGLAVLFFFILCIPLDMVLHADVHGKPRVRLRVSWLFGLVSREISGEKEKPEEKRGAAQGKKKHGWGDSGVIFRILRTKGMLKRLKELVKHVLASFKWRDIVADFRVGLGDPADTGALFAFLGPAAAFLGSSHRHQIRIMPSFGDDAVLEGYSYGVARLRPIRLVPPLLKFAFSVTTIRVARTLISSKWKRKR